MLLLVLLISHCSSQTWDFTRFPKADVPPPIVPSWSDYYKISQLSSSSLPPVKTPLDSLSYPACPARDVGTSGCDWSCYNCTRPTDVVSCPSKSDWGLTFDDGPSLNSILILDALKRANKKATFCVVGSRIPSYPSILLRMHQEGHQICVHTWSHRYLTSQTNDQIVAEFEWTMQAIETVIGQRPLYARPPFGDVDDRVRAVFTAMNLKNLIWTHDTYDWKLNSPALYNFQQSWIIGNFTQWISNSNSFAFGPISLEHDLYNLSVAMAPSALDMVVKAGFNVKPVAECLSAPAYVQPLTIPSAVPGSPSGSSSNPTSSSIPTPKTNHSIKGIQSSSLLVLMLMFFYISALL